jgi:hypothetical protein
MLGETSTRAVPALEWVTTMPDAASASYLASTCGICVGAVPCRLTSTVVTRAARCSSTPNISLNMKTLIRIVQSAEARRFSTYQRVLSRRHRKRAEIYLPTVRFFVAGERPRTRGHTRSGDEQRPTKLVALVGASDWRRLPAAGGPHSGKLDAPWQE